MVDFYQQIVNSQSCGSIWCTNSEAVTWYDITIFFFLVNRFDGISARTSTTAWMWVWRSQNCWVATRPRGAILNWWENQQEKSGKFPPNHPKSMVQIFPRQTPGTLGYDQQNVDQMGWWNDHHWITGWWFTCNSKCGMVTVRLKWKG